jgi:hypothetical protein
MKLVFNRSLTGKCFHGNKFGAVINRRWGFELLFFWRRNELGLGLMAFSKSIRSFGSVAPLQSSPKISEAERGWGKSTDELIPAE